MKSKLIIIFIVIIQGCNHSQKTTSSHDVQSTNCIDELKNLEIESIDLYCFCFSDSIWRTCLTAVRVTPEDLISPNSLIAHTSEKDKIEQFVQLTSKNYRIIDTIQGTDVRLIATFNTKKNGMKTISYFSDSTLCYQDKYLIKYDRNVSPFFREAFNLSVVHCD